MLGIAVGVGEIVVTGVAAAGGDEVGPRAPRPITAAPRTTAAMASAPSRTHHRLVIRPSVRADGGSACRGQPPLAPLAAARDGLHQLADPFADRLAGDRQPIGLAADKRFGEVPGLFEGHVRGHRRLERIDDRLDEHRSR
jgi:hypothetical protein